MTQQPKEHTSRGEDHSQNVIYITLSPQAMWKGAKFVQDCTSVCTGDIKIHTCVLREDGFDADAVVGWGGDLDGVPEVDATLRSHGNSKAQVTGGQGGVLREVVESPVDLKWDVPSAHLYAADPKTCYLTR